MRRFSVGVTLVILSLIAVISLGFFLGTCIYSKNYLGLLIMIPVIGVLLSWYGYSHATDETHEGGWVGREGWIFLLVTFLVVSIGIPVIVYRHDHHWVGVLILQLVGVLFAFVGAIIYYCLDTRASDSY